MAIRTVKFSCLLDYDARKALQEKTGEQINSPRFSISKVGTDADVSLWMPQGKAEHLGLFHISSDEMSHQGRVVAYEVDHSVQIMSDVWADLSYVVVYEPSGMPTGADSERLYESVAKGYCREGQIAGYFRRIQVGNSEFPSYDSHMLYEVDASQEVMDLYAVHKRGRAFAKALSQYDSDQYRLRCERESIRKDKWVRVTRGRKVPQGTEGLVFWIGESQWGNKVGIAIPQEDGTFRMVKKPGKYGNRVFESYADVVFTYSKNVDVISGPKGRVLRQSSDY